MTTSDQTDEFNYIDDARKIFETLRNGGVSINPILSGYAIMGASDDAIKRIYKAKKKTIQQAEWHSFQFQNPQ